jgi:hypothetical protein
VSNRWVIDGLRRMASGATKVIPGHLRRAAESLEASDERISELEDYLMLVRATAIVETSCGRDTYAAEVVAEISARRGAAWPERDILGGRGL